MSAVSAQEVADHGMCSLGLFYVTFMKDMVNGFACLFVLDLFGACVKTMASWSEKDTPRSRMYTSLKMPHFSATTWVLFCST